MTEQLGMGNDATSASGALGAGAVRPRIGADRFRALAERLKRPAVAVPSLAISVAHVEPIAVPPVPPAMGHITLPDLHHAPLAAPVVDAAPADTFSVELPTVEAEPPIVRHEELALEEPIAAEPDPVLVALADPPPPEPAVVWPAEPAVVEASAPALDIAAEEAQPFELPPVSPEVEEAPPPPVYASPLERVLAAEHKVAPPAALPEILPPPPPPPPPRVIEENGEQVTVEAPTMEVVQERLREGATNRLQQLDIENIWRQVLATPTLEERADFLREAAELMAAEQGIEIAEVPPEHDLSRIAEMALPTEPQPAPPPVFNEYNEDEQLETAELARSLLDMMASGSNSGLPHERALASDTLLRLLPKLAAKPLAMLSHRLAMMDNPPQLLVAKLIRDDRVEVSGPLLEDCMHITDQDLAMVVAEENAGKRRMVARRRKLSRAISDKLIATGDTSVLLTLVRNANAEISHDGFGALIEAAAKHDELMAPLSTRADLGAPHAFELFWPAPPQLRRYLLHRFLTDSETLTKILKITLSAQAGDEGKDDIGLPSAGDVMEYLEIACRGRIETAAHKLGEALNVDASTVHRVLIDRRGDALVVLLKAAGFPRSSVPDLLPALKRGEVPLIDDEREVSELQSMFDTLSLNKARILLTYWNWAVRKAGPYAPVH